MRREYLFLVMFLFARVSAVDYEQSGFMRSGRNYYDTITSLASSSREIDSRITRDSYGALTDCVKLHKDREQDLQYGDFDCSIESHYRSIIDEASERRWAIPITLSCFLENRMFDCNGCRVSLSDGLFGEGTTIKDVYLLARLADQDKLHIHPRGSEPTSPQFGHTKEQQYLALLAPVKLSLTAGQQGADFNIGAMYRFRPFSGRRFFGIVGINIPLMAYSRSLDLNFQDGKLFTFGFSANTTVRETTLTQFFKDFSSVEDFFLREVLGSKGLSFDPSQRKVGIGDISFFASLEFGPFLREFDNGYCAGLDAGQIGVNISLPTASKVSGTKLWEMYFGIGGFQISLFGNFLFRTETDFFNPMVHAGVEINTSFNASNAGIRIPQKITVTEEKRISEIDSIKATIYKEYYTDPFEGEVASSVSWFADSQSYESIRRGHRFFIGVGNYFYNVFKTNFRFGVFYNYSHKGEDRIICNELCDPSCLKCKTESHRLSWNLSYKFKNFIETGLGTQHVIAGSNVPEQHELFIVLSASF